MNTQKQTAVDNLLRLMHAILNINVEHNAEDAACAIVAVAANNNVELYNSELFIRYSTSMSAPDAVVVMDRHDGDVLDYFTDEISSFRAHNDFNWFKTICEDCFDFSTIKHF